MKQIQIHTDGGCHGNPGPGAWAFVLGGETDIERSGAQAMTTNNRMELQAVIEALREVVTAGLQSEHVSVHTDSQYVRNGITTWIKTWVRNGWRTAAKKPVKNQDLWIRLHELDGVVQPEWIWVRGHAGDPMNERCDALVQLQIAQMGGSG